MAGLTGTEVGTTYTRVMQDDESTGLRRGDDGAITTLTSMKFIYYNSSGTKIISGGLTEDGSGNISLGDGKYLATDQVRAINGDGLKLYDDGGNGIFVGDGGNVGIGNSSLESWRSPSFVALQIGGMGALWGHVTAAASDQIVLSNNVYHDLNDTREEYIFGDEASEYLQQNGTHTFRVAAVGVADAAISWTPAMTIINSGNVGIGVIDPDELLELYKVGTQLKLSGGVADYATFAVAADGALTITTVDTDAAEGDICLMPDGNVGIGVADPDEALEVTGDVHISGLEGGGVDVFADAGGKLIADPSDEKFKKNIKTVENALDMVMKLKGRLYDWRKGSPALGSEYGLVAQEVAEVSENLTVTGKHMGIKSRGIIALLVEAIKEQQKQIEDLKQLVIA